MGRFRPRGRPRPAARRGRKRRTMQQQQGNPKRQVLVAGAAILAIIAGGGAVTTWRWENAYGKAIIAIDLREVGGIAGRLTSIFWRERLTGEHYLLSPTPS